MMFLSWRGHARNSGADRNVCPAVAFAVVCTWLTAVVWAKEPTREDDFLTATALHTIHLRVSPADWRRMEPSNGLFGRMFQAPVRPQDRRESAFGFDFLWVKGSFEHGSAQYGGTLLPEIGLRFKGNSSYMMGEQSHKPPMKLDFDRYVPGQSFRGLSQLNLHNNAMDPSHMREALSYWVFREAGVPASRTAYALVYLTLDGQQERKLLGLYTLVEEVDKRFLESRFGTDKGLLLKPENAFNLPFKGEDFKKYEEVYRPKTEPTPQTSQALIEFLRLIHKADDATFEREIEKRMDVEAFLRFVAANTLLANMDSFLSTGHNFFMYVHPQTLKVHFVPWDLNLSLGGFAWVGNAREQIELSLSKPYVGKNALAERVLKIQRFQAKYQQITRQIVKDVFNEKALNGEMDHFEKVIEAARERALGPATRPTTGPSTLPVTRPAAVGNLAAQKTWWLATPPDVRDFANQRAKTVGALLAGRREGYEPDWVQGPFSSGGRRKPATRPATQPTSRTQATSRPTTAPNSLKPK
jgi:spore coat protein H